MRQRASCNSSIINAIVETVIVVVVVNLGFVCRRESGSVPSLPRIPRRWYRSSCLATTPPPHPPNGGRERAIGEGEPNVGAWRRSIQSKTSTNWLLGGRNSIRGSHRKWSRSYQKKRWTENKHHVVVGFDGFCLLILPLTLRQHLTAWSSVLARKDWQKKDVVLNRGFWIRIDQIISARSHMLILIARRYLGSSIIQKIPKDPV